MVVNDVAVAVVTYNSADHIEALLDSLPAALAGLSHSVVVVDNGSSDETRTLLAARDDCHLVAASNDGYAAGINRAVASSPAARHLLVLNPDATLDPGSVAAMRDVFSRHERVGVVAPRVREQDGSLSPTLRRGPSMGRVGGLSFTGLSAFTERIESEADYHVEHVVDWAVGAVLLVSMEMYDDLGGLDESFFLYSEETDFSLRGADIGWATWYTPGAGAMHIGGGSGESAITHTMKILNRIRLYRRRTGPVRAWVYYAVSVATEFRRAVLGHDRSWHTMEALVWPSKRPAPLGLGDRVFPW